MNKRLYMILLLSLVATAWSLYYGYFGDLVVNIQTGDLRNTAHALIPCNMCRYIRVFMYPIPVLAIIALIICDHRVKYYIIWLSLIALAFCVYKYGLELGLVAKSSDAFICITSASDCSEAKPNYFGWISMSLLAGIANIIIILLASKINHVWLSTGENNE